MNRIVVATLMLLGSLLIPLTATAAQIRAFITEFAVSPPESKDLQTTLKRLLTSRLPGDGLSSVEALPEADVIITGSFTQLGKVFSLDAVAKTPAGRSLATAFEQGDSLDSLIPALGKISAKLRGDILRAYPQPATARPLSEKVPAPEIVRQESSSGWTSRRIAGAQSSLAPGRAKDVLIAEAGAIRLYRQDSALTLLAEAKLPSQQKIIGIDSLDPDQDGRSLAFVTTMDGDAPASKIYAVANGTLKLLAQDLPYLFRAIALNGGPKLLYAQEMGRTEDYYGDVYEAGYLEGSIKLKNPIKMPRFGNIFNFNTFRDQSGKTYITCFSDGGYLIVYSDKGEELWRSSDKFGGSETYFQRRDSDSERFTGTPFRRRFIDQRISVTPQGDVIVPQNAGFFVLGDARSYSKYSVVSFSWNGSSLEERWRTKQSQNYLTDYFYEPVSRELVLLEVVQKEGLFGKGGSALRVIRAD